MVARAAQLRTRSRQQRGLAFTFDPQRPNLGGPRWCLAAVDVVAPRRPSSAVGCASEGAYGRVSSHSAMLHARGREVAHAAAHGSVPAKPIFLLATAQQRLVESTDCLKGVPTNR